MFGKHDSIAAGEILTVIQGMHPTQGDQHQIELNRGREGQLMRRIVDGDIPPSLVAAGLVEARHPKHAFVRDVGENVELHAQPDLVSEGMTISLENGSIHMRMMLKVAMASVARGVGGDVAVHLLYHDQTYMVRGGGRLVVGQVEEITRDAFTINANQKAINKKIGGLPSREKESLKIATATLGAKLHNTVDNACQILRGSMVKFG